MPTHGRPLSLPGTVLVTIVCVVVAGGLLAGCSTSGRTLAQQACQQVSTSIRLLHEAEHDTSPTQAAQDRSTAALDLGKALAPAARAATKSGRWQALDFSLSESGRVPEANLIPALTAECAVAEAPPNQPPPPPLDVQGPPSS